MYYQSLIIIHECSKKLLKIVENLIKRQELLHQTTFWCGLVLNGLSLCVADSLTINVSL